MADNKVKIADKEEEIKNFDTKDQCGEEKKLEYVPLKIFIKAWNKNYNILVEPNDIAICKLWQGASISHFVRRLVGRFVRR